LFLKKKNKLIIKIIDGLGSQAFFPLSNYSTFFAKRYIERRIELMWSRIIGIFQEEKEIGNNKFIRLGNF
jgi:hypothetical protein